MSLFNLILENQRIMLALGAALTPLVLALVLWFALSVRRFAAAQAARRAARREARFLAMHRPPAEAQEQDPSDEPQAIPAADHAPVAVPRPRPAQAAALVGSESVEDEKDEQTTDEAAEGGGEVVSSAMQDLLDSVFGDEEYTNRFEHLMDELDDIQAADLARLSDEIAAQLS